MSTPLSSRGLALCLAFVACYTLNVFTFELFQSKQEAPLGQLILFRGTLVIWVIALIYLVLPQSRETILRGFDLAFGSDWSADAVGTRVSTENAPLWILVSTVSAQLLALVFWLLSLKEMSSGDMIVILEVSNTTLAVSYAAFWLRERVSPALIGCFVGILAGLIVMLRPSFLFGPIQSDGSDKDFRDYSPWPVLCALGSAVAFFAGDAALYRFRGRVDAKVLTFACFWQESAVSAAVWILILVVFGMDHAWRPLSDFSVLSVSILWMLAPLEVLLNGTLVMAITSVPFYFFNSVGSMATLLSYLLDVWLLNEVEHWTVYAGAAITVASLVLLTCNADDSTAETHGSGEDEDGRGVYQPIDSDEDDKVVVV